MPLSPPTSIFPFYKLRRVLDADLYSTALVDDVRELLSCLPELRGYNIFMHHNRMNMCAVLRLRIVDP